MSDWQPIETAPKDGTEILLFRPVGNGEISIGNWNVSAGYWWSDHGMDYLIVQPILWQPLPKMPDWTPEPVTPKLAHYVHR